jgi:riboflavin kinase / FMN adenylyltransferase
VRHGDARGRTIGFPTANLAQDDGTCWPSFGVYAGWVAVGGERHRAAVNIGTRPTVYGSSGVPLLEAHLLDFDGDLYGQNLRVAFVKRLRGEKRFPGREELIAAMNRDVAEAREVLAR